jgi:hypothetical protein
LLLSVHRHHKEVAGGHVTLHPDYALLPAHLADPDQTVDTFCVEVKPKQGWVPPHSRNLPKCTYCTKQFLKVRQIFVLLLLIYLIIKNIIYLPVEKRNHHS